MIDHLDWLQNNEEDPSPQGAAEAPAAPTRPQYYSIVQVAEMFGRSTRTVRDWVQKDRVKSFSIGKSRYIAASELARLQGEEGV